MDLTAHWVGITCIVVFVLSYSLVIAEEFTHLRKSVPVMLGAGIIWALIAAEYAGGTMTHATEEAVRHFLIEFGELFLFLLCAMTYVNSMTERRVFDALRSWLVRRGFNFRQLFWITGVLSFFLSPIIDNLTTALVMCAVVMAVGRDNPRFIGIGCVNIVVAANAGGAFSPFGDITTLMVWQRGILDFWTFFALFVPSVVNYIIPAVIMAFFVENVKPNVDDEHVVMRRGARRIMFLFGCTVATAVSFHNFLHLPPFLGMMTGLAYLKIFGHYLAKTSQPAGAAARKVTKRATFNPSTASVRWLAPSGIRCSSFSASSCASAVWASSAILNWSRSTCMSNLAPPSPTPWWVSSPRSWTTFR